MIDEGIGGIGKVFGEVYCNLLCEELLEILQEEEFIVECDVLVCCQQEIEVVDIELFVVWFVKYV